MVLSNDGTASTASRHATSVHSKDVAPSSKELARHGVQYQRTDPAHNARSVPPQSSSNLNVTRAVSVVNKKLLRADQAKNMAPTYGNSVKDATYQTEVGTTFLITEYHRAVLPSIKNALADGIRTKVQSTQLRQGLRF